ncbi:MAG: class I SAM-dependent methyltransferase, partial [Roseovarius sp.]
LGCGLGLKSSAMALLYPEAQVIGIDVTHAFRKLPKLFARHLSAPLPENLSFRQIEAGAPLPEDLAPDVVYSWSVMEHIGRAALPGVIRDLAARLAPGGVVLTQIAPLYHSPFGSHLQEFNPTPWAHLTLSIAELEASLNRDAGPKTGVGSADWMFARFLELNKITADELALYFSQAGFSQAENTRRTARETPPEWLRLAHDKAALGTYEIFFAHRLGTGGPRLRGWFGRR